MSATPNDQRVKAIRIRSAHAGTVVVLDVQLAGEDFFRRVFAEDVVDGTLISHEVLPPGMTSGDPLDF